MKRIKLNVMGIYAHLQQRAAKTGDPDDIAAAEEWLKNADDLSQYGLNLADDEPPKKKRKPRPSRIKRSKRK